MANAEHVRRLLPGFPAAIRGGTQRLLGAVAVCILLVVALLACDGGGEDSTGDERMTEMEAKAQSLEEQLAALEEGQVRIGERLDDLDARIRELEEADAKAELGLSDKEQWAKSKDDGLSSEGSALERTVSLVEDSGGEVHYVAHPERGDRTVLVTPTEFVDGETPLIVSLHGFGGDSAYQAMYLPLHERVNTDGFALLLPNGIRNGEGDRFWNPTDHVRGLERATGAFTEMEKSGEDDVAYLTELVAEAKKVRDFGPVYFFGYSNGGFMSYHIACKGLPGLRAVASLAGTSYVEDSSCEGAPPVSVLHVHGTDDEVILFEGDESEPDPKGDGETAFYAGAQDMVTRWGQRAGCDEHLQPYATLDLDRYVPGTETQAFRLESGCAEGISIELWMGEGSSHAPGYGDAFLDTLTGWLLAQQP